MNDHTSHSEKPMERSSMLQLFQRMGDMAAAQGRQFEIAVFGGSALALSFDWRESTMDVDYMPIQGAAAEINALANVASKQMGWPQGILRDDVSIFAADHPEMIPQGDYPANHEGGLRVFLATPEYLLSMKILSMRSSIETQDCRDVWHLLDACEIHTVENAEKLVEQFYPDGKIPLRNHRILEDIIKDREDGKPYSSMIGW